MEIRKCNKCQENKVLTEFFKDKTRKNGYGYKCKSCHSHYIKQSQKDHYNKWGKNSYLKNKKKRNKDALKYLNSKKDGYHTIYYIPSDNYVGITDNVYNRMTWHKSHNRDPSNYQILYKTKSRDEGLELEEFLHSLGYKGKRKETNF